MRKMLAVLLLISVAACKEDDEAPASINGYWTVETPDGATTVTFRIAQQEDITETIVNHNGKSYTSKPVDAGFSAISEHELESITFVNNNYEIPFFIIRFQQVTINSDFTEMSIATASFNIDGVFRQFTDLRATRN